MKKIETQSNHFEIDLFMIVKSTLKHFGFTEPSTGLCDGEIIIAWTTMDFLNKKTFIVVHATISL